MKKFSKKKKLSIISIFVVMVLFIISGISSMASELAQEGSSSGPITNFIKLNTCKLVDTSKELQNVTNKENIPYVVVVKEKRGLFGINESSANVWTPVQLTDAQKMSFVRTVGACIRNTVKTTTLDKNRIENYNHAVNNLNRGSVKWFTPEGTSLITKLECATIDTSANKIRVVDNSTDKDHKYVLFGSFTKATSETLPTTGVLDATLSDIVSAEENNDICKPIEDNNGDNNGNNGGNTNSEKKFVAILDAGIHMPGAEFSQSTTEGAIPFVAVYKDYKVNVLVYGDLTDAQKESFTKQLKASFKTVYDAKVNIAYSDNNTYTYYKTVTTNGTATFGGEYKATLKDKKYTVTASNAANLEWYCGGHIELRDSEVLSTTTIKDYRSEENKSTIPVDKKYVQINSAYLADISGKLSVGDTKENIPYIVVTDGESVNIWTRVELTDSEKESFVKILDKTFYTIPLSGKATIINTAKQNNKISFVNSEVKNCIYKKSLDLAELIISQNDITFVQKAGKNIEWYIGGYFKIVDVEVTTNPTIEDKRQKESTPTPTPGQPTPTPGQPTPTPGQPTPTPGQSTPTPEQPTPEVNNIPNPTDEGTLTPVNPSDDGQTPQVSGEPITKNDDTPKTGDNTNTLIFVILGIVSLFGIGYFLKLKKRFE